MMHYPRWRATLAFALLGSAPLCSFASDPSAPVLREECRLDTTATAGWGVLTTVTHAAAVAARVFLNEKTTAEVQEHIRSLVEHKIPGSATKINNFVDRAEMTRTKIDKLVSTIQHFLETFGKSESVTTINIILGLIAIYIALAVIRMLIRTARELAPFFLIKIPVRRRKKPLDPLDIRPRKKELKSGHPAP